MFAVRTRNLGNNPDSAAAFRAEEEPAPAPIHRTVSNPTGPGSLLVEALASDLRDLKMNDENVPLAAACQNALTVLATPTKRTARARKLAEMDQRHKQMQRLSLDETSRRRGSQPK